MACYDNDNNNDNNNDNDNGLMITILKYMFLVVKVKHLSSEIYTGYHKIGLGGNHGVLYTNRCLSNIPNNRHIIVLNTHHRDHALICKPK